MDATLATGWIGLIGASVGAGAALLGGWLQHRQQARTDRQKQIDERGHIAGTAALTELYALRRHILRWGTDLDSDSRSSWAQSGEALADQAEMAAGLIPQAPGVRTRMEEALWVVVTCMHNDENRLETKAYSSKRAVDHAIDILQAFMRGDLLPRISGGVDILRIERDEYRRENPPELD